MAHNPTDIGSCPVHIARINTIDVLHGPLQRHKMTAIVANNPFRLSGGTGGIENVERIRCGERNAFVWLCRLHDFIPVAVAAHHELSALHVALKNHTSPGFVPGNSKRFVEEGLVRNYSLDLYTTRADTITFGLASSMRAASSFAAKPPNTTQWTAPRRPPPTIASAASGTIGM